ncbi:MAG: acetyl-CoA C-acyltransferase [Anaerolineales bacterium]|nr:acetyl-CoA C-acyltransferase [Anaerolineales bacterium]
MKIKFEPARDPVIVAAVRTPVGKAKRGTLTTYRPEDMAAAVINELFNRLPQLEPGDVDDLIVGCAFPEGEQGMNLARLIGFRAGLPVEVPAETVNRFCSSGVQSIAHGAQGIMAGQIDTVLAGGVESMSMVPMTGYKFSPHPQLAETYPEAYTSMGITAENVADAYDVDRNAQDEFALTSHQRAVKALETGRFEEQIVPLEVTIKTTAGEKILQFSQDEGPRADTSLEALARLRPAFKEGGTVTAGNSSQMSDGAAGVVIMSRQKAADLGLKPLARFAAYAAAGVPPEIMGIGPIKAVPKVLKLMGMKLEDIQLIELNEAFASQSIAVIRELGLNREITNVNGGAIALGHPLGCTGAKLTTQMIYELKRQDLEWGLVTMCIGGGMGAAAVIQNLT